MPASRAATAICSAPLEWPSRPGLATRNFGGPPGIALHPLGDGAEPAGRRAAAPPTPVGRPVLAEHLAHHGAPLAGRAAGPGQGDRRRHDVLVRTRRPAAARRARRATAASSRAARQAATSAIVSASTAGSTRRIAPSPPSGDGSVSVNRLTPTTTCSPDSMRRVRSAIDATSRRLQRLDGVERAAHRQHVVELGLRRLDAARRCGVSTTCEPSKRSSYSSRSLS